MGPLPMVKSRPDRVFAEHRLTSPGIALALLRAVALDVLGMRAAEINQRAMGSRICDGY
jgi:hypothetical protein